MIRTIALQGPNGEIVVLETAMNAAFLERMYPGWSFIGERCAPDFAWVNR